MKEVITLKKRIFISGVTGTMGGAGLEFLLEDLDSLSLVTIVRDTKKNRSLVKKYEDKIDIIWGDLTVYSHVKEALKDVDYILHLAALVSPEADSYPEKAWQINVGSVENILKAIEELGLKEVKLVYIGSVAETGSRLFPIHWGRVGDPLKPSQFDNYAVTKIAGERLIIESNLKYWVSLRQTGILHKGLIDIRDGIIFHQPLNNVLEWITEKDSGRLLAHICLKDLPEDFWKNIYNIGGGQSTRENNYNFMNSMLETMGIKSLERIYEANWFALRNFHGHYYLDSHILNNYLDFRRESIEDFLKRLSKEISFPNKLLKFLPRPFIKKFIMKPMAAGKHGPLSWIDSKDMDKINASWGSLERWETIKDWHSLNLDQDWDKKTLLDHGYDENKDIALLNIEDMKKAASFRGGKCLSSSMIEGDLESKLQWQCAFSHRFLASPMLVLKAGHWCPECQAPPWDYEKIARSNPFFAQVWDKEDLI